MGSILLLLFYKKENYSEETKSLLNNDNKNFKINEEENENFIINKENENFNDNQQQLLNNENFSDNEQILNNKKNNNSIFNKNEIYLNSKDYKNNSVTFLKSFKIFSDLFFWNLFFGFLIGIGSGVIIMAQAGFFFCKKFINK